LIFHYSSGAYLLVVLVFGLGVYKAYKLGRKTLLLDSSHE
jgi:hypothetical protein